MIVKYDLLCGTTKNSRAIYFLTIINFTYINQLIYI